MISPPAKPPLWFIFSVTVTGILANTLLSPNIPDILSDLGQSQAMAGRLVASAALPGVFVAPLIGIAADRIGRRRVLLPCLVLFGLAGLGTAVAPTFGWLLGIRIAQGIGGAGLINLVVVMIGDHWSGEERTALIGRNSAVLTLCLALVPSFSGIMAELTNWRWSLAVSVLALPVAAVGYRVLPAVTLSSERTVRDQLHQSARAIRQPLLLAIMASSFVLFMVIFGVFLTVLPVHLKQDFDLGPGLRGIVLSTPAIGSTLAAFNLGRIRSRFRIRSVLVGAGIFISLAALGIGLAPTIAVVVAFLIMYGLGDGLTISTLQDATASAAPDGQRASMMAGFVSATRLGQTLGPLAAAAVFTATSTTTATMAGAALFALVTIGFLFGPIDEAHIERSAKA